MPNKSTNSKRARKSHQSAKPYDDFPLTAHPSGRWCKKFKGKQHYFGRIEDWEVALDLYKHEWRYIVAGKTPPPMSERDSDACTMGQLSNEFLTVKQNRLSSGELSGQSFRSYYETCEALIRHFGKHRRVDDLKPIDFEGYRKVIADRFAATGLLNEVNRCRVLFKFALDQGLIEKAVAYGQSFNRPPKLLIRRAKFERGPQIFEPPELFKIIDAADPVIHAMVLLGLNCGFGNTDVASLPQTAIDWDSGWVEFPRPKSQINRRIPLWDETIEAVQAAIAVRPKASLPQDAQMCFLTTSGNRWVRIRQTDADNGRLKVVPIDALSQKFRKLLTKLDINGNRGFYALRHTFETIGGESRDQVAVNAIMGHVDNSMAATYRERISEERLRAVVDVVRAWLWPDAAKSGGDGQ